MADLGRLLVPLLAGVGVGLLHFGGLWLTVRRLPLARRPALLALSSLLVRTTLAVAGFVLLLDGQPLRLAAALAGFLAARSLLLGRLRPPGATVPLDRPAGGGR